MKPIVEVENLSKLFRLGAIGASSVRESLEALFRKKSGSNGTSAPETQIPTGRAGPEPNTFWGLKDVSFTVQPGEVVGIIGRNGAGKSTLLKILSRITEPTSGRAILRGRVVSLLEVGTGFHPELSGRENIFLNGAILGMKRAEIAAKFDEIVAFAEVGPFLDTPVKRYSSGMYVRLAFAVAAHLEPEILVIDEVLAVGDAAFQKKCLGKMSDVARAGRTVLFVSHNMQALQSLCGRAVHLEQGSVAAIGTSQAVVSEYLAAISSATGEKRWPLESAPGNEFCKLTAIRVITGDGVNGSNGAVLPSKRDLSVELEFVAEQQHQGLCVGFDLTNSEGVTVLRSYQTDGPSESWPEVRVGTNRWRCVIPAGLLNGGVYFVCPRIGIHNVSWIVNIESAVEFELMLDHGVSPFWNSLSASNRPGLVAPILRWQDAVR
jgi:lipopolysaccharide transport system ATP-binding protein